MTAPSANGFRRLRFGDGDGSDYSAIFEAEYHGSDFASDTFATDDARYEYTVVGDDDSPSGPCAPRAGSAAG